MHQINVYCKFHNFCFQGVFWENACGSKWNCQTIPALPVVHQVIADCMRLELVSVWWFPLLDFLLWMFASCTEGERQWSEKSKILSKTNCIRTENNPQCDLNLWAVKVHHYSTFGQLLAFGYLMMGKRWEKTHETDNDKWEHADDT